MNVNENDYFSFSSFSNVLLLDFSEDQSSI